MSERGSSGGLDSFHNRIVSITEQHHPMMGAQTLITFSNGWSASIRQGPGSYGGDQGGFELGVIGPDGELDYNNPVTPDDVIGWLDSSAVRSKLHQLAMMTEEDLQAYRLEFSEGDNE